MGSPETDRRRNDAWERSPARRIVTIAVVVAMVASTSVGFAAASGPSSAAQEAGNADTYAVEQGGDCFVVTPVTGNESVKSFYDYRTPFPNNPFSNATGQSYSSEGTTDLQRPNTSSLFLYRSPSGNLSLVILHGATDDASAGGAVTFNITGLPEDGAWVVKDDEYQGESNYDNWTSESGTTQVNWTWGAGKTDGGAYAGLGETFTITIDPAFNREAALFGEHYNGTIDNWTVISNGAGAYERRQLDMSQPVTISSGGCDGAATAGNGAGDDSDDGLPGASAGNEPDDGFGATGDDDHTDANETESDDEPNETESPTNGNGTDWNRTDPDDNVTSPDDNATIPDGNGSAPNADNDTRSDDGNDIQPDDGNESTNDGDDTLANGNDTSAGDDGGDDAPNTDGQSDGASDDGIENGTAALAETYELDA